MSSKISRRRFLQTAAMAAGATMLPMPIRWLGTNSAYAFAWSMPLRKFIQPMPLFGAGIPLAQKVQIPNPAVPGAFLDPYTGVDYYEINAGVFRQQLHPNLPNPTRLYGYYDKAKGTNAGTNHLQNAIVATKGKPVRIKYGNTLPQNHIIPFDPTIPAPNVPSGRQDRSAVHLHGGLVPWASDGGPFHWIDSIGGRGTSAVDWLPDTTGALTNDYYYPNNQSERLMWYHDHAIGTTRTSAYAGLATGYVLIDPAISGATLPIPTPIVFQDKIFWNPANDPNYNKLPSQGGGGVTDALPGDLWYPYIYDPARWAVAKGGVPPIPSCIPEFFGDTMLTNGVVYPYHKVDKTNYRFQLLNACNARFLNLTLVYEDPLVPGEPQFSSAMKPVYAPVTITQIGVEGGLLPTRVNIPAGIPILLGPAERADLVLDFSLVPAGRKVILYNDAPAPFPGGVGITDFYPGNNKNPIVTQPGFGPNTRTILQFQVSGTATTRFTVPASFPVTVLPTVPDPVNGGLKLNLAPGQTWNSFTVLGNTQELTLNETFDAKGRLIQLVGTNVKLNGVFGREYLSAPTETVNYNTIQIWNIYNLTADTHPMHVHLFNAMVLRRRKFNSKNFNGVPAWQAIGVGPAPEEKGWKETFKMNPGECTTIAIMVENPLPGRTVSVTVAGNTIPFIGTLPTSPRLPGFDEYVWHCHILEHEEHDMMRPLQAT